MKYFPVFVFLLAAMFFACNQDKGTGPNGGGDNGYALEGCWESFLIEEYTDSGWVDITNGRIDTLVFYSDSTWKGHRYSFNPFDSSLTSRTDFGEIKLSTDTVFIQSQNNLAVFVPYHYSISNDTLVFDENDETVTATRDFWNKSTCDL